MIKGLRFTIKGGRGSGWFAPPKGTHVGDTSGSGIGRSTAEAKEKAKERLNSLPISDVSGFINAGPEISTNEIWPNSVGKKLILGARLDEKTLPIEKVQLANLIPSQFTVVKSGVEKYIDDPFAKPLGREEASPIPIVGLFKGQIHIETGTHRLAAHILLGETFANVKMRYYIEKLDRYGRPLAYEVPRREYAKKP